jgi:hypothetical protein
MARPSIADALKRPEKSDSTSEKYADARKERYEKREKALKYLKEFVDASGDEKALKAMRLIKPSLYGLFGRGTAGPSLATQFVDLVKDKKNVTEMDVFLALKIGRKECSNLIRSHLRKSEPADRVWIAFDGNMYAVAGTGPQPPKSWEGFVPVDEVEDISQPAPAQAS